MESPDGGQTEDTVVGLSENRHLSTDLEGLTTDRQA